MANCRKCGAEIEESATLCAACEASESATETSEASESQSSAEGTCSICSCLKKYAVFAGRASRAEFWPLAILYLLPSVGIKLALSQFGASITSDSLYNWLGYFSWAWLLLGLLPFSGVAVRRMHDTGRSGGIYVALVFALVLNRFAEWYGWTARGKVSPLVVDQVEQAAFWATTITMVVAGLLALVFFVRCFFRSVPGENQFGPEPRA